jgi:hypothetical protein
MGVEEEAREEATEGGNDEAGTKLLLSPSEPVAADSCLLYSRLRDRSQISTSDKPREAGKKHKDNQQTIQKSESHNIPIDLCRGSFLSDEMREPLTRMVLQESNLFMNLFAANGGQLGQDGLKARRQSAGLQLALLLLLLPLLLVVWRR